MASKFHQQRYRRVTNAVGKDEFLQESSRWGRNRKFQSYNCSCKLSCSLPDFILTLEATETQREGSRMGVAKRMYGWPRLAITSCDLGQVTYAAWVLVSLSTNWRITKPTLMNWSKAYMKSVKWCLLNQNWAHLCRIINSDIPLLNWLTWRERAHGRKVPLGTVPRSGGWLCIKDSCKFFVTNPIRRWALFYFFSPWIFASLVITLTSWINHHWIWCCGSSWSRASENRWPLSILLNIDSWDLAVMKSSLS